MSKDTQEGAAGVDTRETRKPQMFKVLDMNQFGPLPRRHEIITKMYPKEEGIPPETITYELWRDSSKACEMPLDHAMKFLKEPAFHVFGPDGRRIEPITQIDPSKPLSQLADHEVIANLNELSRDALFRRVKVIPGSEGIGANAKAEELVAFLIDWKKRQKKMSQGEAALADMMTNGQLGGGMTPEMLSTMFPQRRAA